MVDAAVPHPASAAPRTGAAEPKARREKHPHAGMFDVLNDVGILPARRNGAPPVGLVTGFAGDEELQRGARRLSRCAPLQYGQLEAIYLRGQRVLETTDRQVLDQLIQGGIRAASFCTDEEKPLGAKGVAALDDRVRYAGEYLRRREGEIARRRYAWGMLVGVLISIVVLGAVEFAAEFALKHWIANGSEVPVVQINAVRSTLIAVAGGAAGACVSVLLRLHRVRNLSSDVAFGGAALYRILLGWFFAASIVFLLQSGALDGLVVVPDPTIDDAARVQSWFFWGSLGFLAGFNERWATNLIAREPGNGVVKKADAAGSAGDAKDADG